MFSEGLVMTRAGDLERPELTAGIEEEVVDVRSHDHRRAGGSRGRKSSSQRGKPQCPYFASHDKPGACWVEKRFTPQGPHEG